MTPAAKIRAMIASPLERCVKLKRLPKPRIRDSYSQAILRNVWTNRWHAAKRAPQ